MPGAPIGGVISHTRAPTDPFFYADVEVQNARAGSAYMLGYLVSGEFTPLAGFSGTVAGTENALVDFTLTNVPSYAATMVLELRLRKGTSGTKYQPYSANAVHSSNGVIMYVSQVPDDIA